MTFYIYSNVQKSFYALCFGHDMVCLKQVLSPQLQKLLVIGLRMIIL